MSVTLLPWWSAGRGRGPRSLNERIPQNRTRVYRRCSLPVSWEWRTRSIGNGVAFLSGFAQGRREGRDRGGHAQSPWPMKPQSPRPSRHRPLEDSTTEGTKELPRGQLAPLRPRHRQRHPPERERPDPGGAVRPAAPAGRRGSGRLDASPPATANVTPAPRALDLNQKRHDYRFAGVRESLVVCTEERELRWYNFAARRRLSPDAQGVDRSRVFPGLGVDGAALLALDSERVAGALRRGLAAPEHAAFVEQLRRAGGGAGPDR